MCDDAWGTVDASVACRQLGFSGHSKCSGIAKGRPGRARARPKHHVRTYC